MKCRFVVALCFIAFIVGCEGDKYATLNEVAPEIAAMDLEGKSVNLSDFSGKAVALVFYKNGCEACVGVIPALDSYAKSANLTAIAINTGNTKDEIAEFLEETPLPNTLILRDSLGLTTKRFIINLTPTIILLDKAHIMRGKIIGASDFGKVEAHIKEMLSD